jgi:tetratricopeptide (TPR) repeat protein
VGCSTKEVVYTQTTQKVFEEEDNLIFKALDYQQRGDFLNAKKVYFELYDRSQKKVYLAEVAGLSFMIGDSDAMVLIMEGIKKYPQDQNFRRLLVGQYVKEKRFDEAEKARLDSNKRLKDRFDRLMVLLSKDRNAALAEAKIIEGNMGEGIIAAQLRAGNYAKAYDLFNKAAEAEDKIKLERVKQAAKPTRVEQLPSGLEKTLEKVGSANVALNRADQTKQREFFGVAPSDTIADLIVSGVEKGLPVGDVMRSLGVNAPKVTREAVEWWKDYQSFVAQVRNQLFGATLTPREAGDFRKFNVGPATDPDVAEDYFRRQIQIVRNAVERERRKGRARGVSDETLSSFLDLPQDEVVPGSQGGAPATPAPRAGGPRPPAFGSVEEADAAFAAGTIRKGDEITVGGRRAIYE